MNSTQLKVAIKIINKNRIENKQDLARVRREIEFMSRLNHPHIVKIIEGMNKHLLQTISTALQISQYHKNN
jgi:serine/threonine protein kinase